MLRSSVLVASLLTLLASSARAQTQGAGSTRYELLRSHGAFRVRVSIRAGADGAYGVPEGTILGGGGVGAQDLIIGRGFRVELEAGEVHEVELWAYCIHQDRPAPRMGSFLSPVGRDGRLGRFIHQSRLRAERRREEIDARVAAHHGAPKPEIVEGALARIVQRLVWERVERGPFDR